VSNKTNSPNSLYLSKWSFASFSPIAVTMVCPCNPKAILDANNFTTAGHNMMIDISKESFERAPLDHIILTNLIVP